MIQKASGEIDLGQGVRVGPSFTEAQFLSSPLVRISRALSEARPWSGYRTERLLLGRTTFRVSLRFYNGKLASLELYEVGNQSKASWNDWSGREELERKASHDAWLEGHLGEPPYNYPWGEITSGTDPRGGYSSIVVQYGPAASPK